MPKTVQPSKEQVRAFMAQRAKAHTPPPSPSEIRMQLGWRMLEAERYGKSTR